MTTSSTRVYYALDNNLSKHVLETANYRFGEDAPEDSWVLLEPIEGHPAAERIRVSSRRRRGARGADREAMAVQEVEEREAMAAQEAAKAAKAGQGQGQGGRQGPSPPPPSAEKKKLKKKPKEPQRRRRRPKRRRRLRGGGRGRGEGGDRLVGAARGE